MLRLRLGDREALDCLDVDHRRGRPGRMALIERDAGARGAVLFWEPDRGKSPAREFLEGLQERDRRKFNGNFGALLRLGPEHRNRERFTPLSGKKGKPLWEFKEHDHRLYCLRRQVGSHVYAVLLNGWTKDKAGKGRQEAREIKRAQSLRNAAEAALDAWLQRRNM